MNTGNLVVAQDLHSALDESELVIVDCRFDLFDPEAGRRAYEAGHIPGAVYADLDRDLAAPVRADTGRHPLPDAEVFSETLGRFGISNSNRVVVYDGGNGGIAARCWWLLRWLGHENAQLLDGGFAAWQRAGYALVTGSESRTPAEFRAAPRKELVATTEEITKLAERGLVLVDARDRTRFRGENEPIDTVAGHVPGSVNLPFQVFLDDQGNWLDPASRNAIWREFFGGDAPGDWAVMCGSGVTACHLIVSAVDAGLPEPRLYVGSWSEWIRDSNRPVASGDS